MCNNHEQNNERTQVKYNSFVRIILLPELTSDRRMRIHPYLHTIKDF